MSQYNLKPLIRQDATKVAFKYLDYPVEIFHVMRHRDGRLHFNQPIVPSFLDTNFAGYFDFIVNEIAPEKVFSVREGSKIMTIGINDLTDLQRKMIWTLLVNTWYLDFTELASIHKQNEHSSSMQSIEAWKSALGGIIPAESLCRMLSRIDVEGIEIAGTEWSFRWLLPYYSDPRESLLFSGLRSASRG